MKTANAFSRRSSRREWVSREVWSSRTLIKAIRDVFSGGAPMWATLPERWCSISTPLGPPEEANNLSPREQQVAFLAASGYLYKEIGDR